MLVKTITKKLNYRIVDYLLDNIGIVTSIAKKLGSKKANVSRALRELEAEDIVTKHEVGKSHSYGFNYLHPDAKGAISFILMNRANELNTRLNNLPKFINAYLKLALGENYLGLVVFGSSLTQKYPDHYNDIDLFIILNARKKNGDIINVLKSINQKISPLIGSKEELKKGIINEDSLYKNIIKGVPFGCWDLIFNLRYCPFFFMRKDIEERFIIGYREIQSCKKYQDDTSYIRNHLEKGIFDIIYALLNYKQAPARDDVEATQLFREIYKLRIPATLKQAELFSERMGKVIFH